MKNGGDKNSAVNKPKKRVTAIIKVFQLFIPLFYINHATVIHLNVTFVSTFPFLPEILHPSAGHLPE